MSSLTFFERLVAPALVALVAITATLALPTSLPVGAVALAALAVTALFVLIG